MVRTIVLTSLSLMIKLVYCGDSSNFNLPESDEFQTFEDIKIRK
jgi:hypothetical protein